MPTPSLGDTDFMKLIISSQLAFRKFLLSRFNVCMNVMIIDEVVDRALDSVSIQKLLGILLQLSQKENTNIYIISHRGEVETMFKDMPDTQMMVVQKENNISCILRDWVIWNIFEKVHFTPCMSRGNLLYYWCWREEWLWLVLRLESPKSKRNTRR